MANESSTKGSIVATENYFKGGSKLLRCSSRVSVGSHHSSVQSSKGDVIEICDEESETDIQTKL